jgi:ATP-dependent DNA helicase PIF1
MANIEIEDVNLNDEQLKALKLMEDGENILLTGPAGCGKSTIIKYFYAIQTLGGAKNIYITSTTGRSALLIGGTTLHSLLGIGIGDMPLSAMKLEVKKRNKIHIWKNIRTLIIDEVSMLAPALFNKLYFLAQEFRNDKRPFGGIQIILSGDFLQLPAITDCLVCNLFCFEAETWKSTITNTMYMPTILRQSNKVYSDILLNLRVGKMTESDYEVLISRNNIPVPEDLGIEPTKLFALKKYANKVNEDRFKKLISAGASPKRYNAVICPSANSSAYELRNNYLPHMNIVDNLELCVGAQVILLANIDIDNGLVNGSIGIIKTFESNYPVVKFFNGKIYPVIPFKHSCRKMGKEIGYINQIPLKLGYATTIHYSQGSTLDCIELDFNGIFEYGQAYVGLSRVKTLEGLFIRNFSEKNIKADPKALKFYDDLL